MVILPLKYTRGEAIPPLASAASDREPEEIFMKQLLSLLAALAAVLLTVPAPAADPDDEKPSAKESLKALNDFIGTWNGNGGPPRGSTKKETPWSETVSWGWRFKGDDAWLTLKVAKGKYVKSGEMRYLLDKKRYQLTLADKNDKKMVFEGEMAKNGVLSMDRVDPGKKEAQRITMTVAGDGARFIYKFSHKPPERTLFTPDYEVACTKEGEALGAKEKKNKCVVSGGVGTIPVMFGGKTYFVCCTGCRDAFNDNPEKFIKEFEAKQKMGDE
jgi:hypothetical protein